MTSQETGVNAQASELKKIQTDLQTLADRRPRLMDPSLFKDTQTVTSTNSAVVSTAINSSGMGAVQGGYQIDVSKLATAAQKTFTYSPPSGPGSDNVRIDGQHRLRRPGGVDLELRQLDQPQLEPRRVRDGDRLGHGRPLESLDRQPDRLLHHRRRPRRNLGADPAQTGADDAGQDAQYTVNGKLDTSQTPPGPFTSSSNTLTSAIPGVTLTLTGLTTPGVPVTVDVSAPAPSEANVQSAVQTFVSAYNSVIGEIQTQLSQTPSSSDPTQGSLYNDQGLSDLLTSMRQAMYATQSSQPEGPNSMLDLGVSTGATTGSATPSQSSIDGDLTLDASTLLSGLQGNPTGVQNLLISWAGSFAGAVNEQAGGGGVIDSRVSSDGSQASHLATQIANMNAALQLKESHARVAVRSRWRRLCPRTNPRPAGLLRRSPRCRGTSGASWTTGGGAATAQEVLRTAD